MTGPWKVQSLDPARCRTAARTSYCKTPHHWLSWPATAVAGKQVAPRGDTLVASRGSEVRFEGTVSGVTGGEIQVILDGRRVPLPKDPHIRSASASFEFPWRSDGKRHWIRVDVRDGASRSSELTQCCFLP